MGDIFYKDFGDLNTYVPKFYLQSLVTNPSEHQSFANEPHQALTYSEFPMDLQWYIRPSQDFSQDVNFNKHEISRPNDTNIYDSLVNKLIIDHGWKLEDFDNLNNKAKSLVTKYGHDYNENIKNKEIPFEDLKTTNKNGKQYIS